MFRFVRIRAASAIAALVVCGVLAAWVSGAFASSSPAGVRRHVGASVATVDNGSIKGLRELCGGPYTGTTKPHCGVATKRWAVCVESSDGTATCQYLDRAAALNANGQRVRTARIKHGRFWMHLAPARYKVEFLFTSKHTKPAVAAGGTFHVKVRAGRVTTVVFKGWAG